MLRILLSFLVAISLFFCDQPVASAQSGPVSGEQAAYDIVNTSINQLPPMPDDGYVPDYGDFEGVDYNLGREWNAGDSPADVLKVGDLETGLGVELLTLEQIEGIIGADFDEIMIGSLEFLEGVSMEQFLRDVPFLGEWTASEIPELEQFSEYGALFSGELTLGEIIAQNPEIGEMEVRDVIGDVAIGDIPNLEKAQLKDFEGVGDKTISDVPGLGDVPLGSFPIPVAMPSLNFFPMQDISFGEKEYSGLSETPQSVSGGTNGTQTWMPMACVGGCPHIELTDTGWEGAQWMTKEHRVKDGFGFLGAIYDEAGAYRVPFGPAFALQVTKTDEKTGAAEWGLAFRFCKRGIIDLGCTAYFMEVPLGIETIEGDDIITGVRDGLGGSTIPLDAPAGWEEKRPDLPADLQQIANVSNSNSHGASLCGDGPGGVKFEALGEAYHQIESRGSGDYGAIGVHVSLSYQETGRAFGRYQYMSYRSDVQQAISGVSGGDALLAKARIKGANITSQEMLNVFPPEEQDKLFIADQTYMIELALKRGYIGDRLLEVLAQMHFRGPGVLDSRNLDSKHTTDSLGTSLYEYGRRFKQYYREAESKLVDGDEESRCKETGNFINPMANGLVAFTRRFSATERPHPVRGTASKHDGDDIASLNGSQIVASDGGVVEYYTEGGSNGTVGYGWMIIVKHGNGFESWYAHLSKRLISDGSRVAQGDVIALSGGAENAVGSGTSTGPHLHFEIRKDGIPIPPSSVVDYNKSVKDL